MMAEQTFDTQIDLLQHQRRRIALLVHPDNKRIADHHARLMQQPVGEVIVRPLLRQRDPPDINLPLRIAAYQQLRPVYFQVGQTQLCGEQRHPRHTAVNARQYQGGLMLPVQNTYVGKTKVRAQPLPITFDPADGDRITDRACQRSGDHVVILLDVRQ